LSSTSYYNAFLWNGSAASAVNLNPPTFSESTAVGVSGSNQVGGGFGGSTAYKYHALLWHNTASSVTDLNPSGASHSYAWAVSGNIEVGDARGDSTGDNTHAVLWNGTAASAVDLNPAGFDSSTARGVSQAGEVGFGWNAATGAIETGHALVWAGNAESAIDLHPFLTGLGPTFIYSYAEAISDSGVVVGYATDAANRDYAVVWTPVPEPTTSAMFLCGVAFFLFGLATRLRLKR